MSSTSLIAFEQFEELYNDDQPGKQELIDGEIVSMLPPKRRHSEIAKRVFLKLVQFLDSSRVWQADTGFRVGTGWFEPDVSVIWPDQQFESRGEDGYWAGSPMVAVEILSPQQNIERKLSLYLENGAAEVWVLDPKSRTMTVYQRHGEQSMRIPIRDLYKNDALIPGFQISLTEIFG